VVIERIKSLIFMANFAVTVRLLSKIFSIFNAGELVIEIVAKCGTENLD